MVGVAQRLERRVVAPKAVGSIPIAHPNDIKGLQAFACDSFLVLLLGTCAGIAARVNQNTGIMPSRISLWALRDVLATTNVVMLKILKCPVRVVWVFCKTQWIALFSTDLDLSIEQIIEYL